MKECSFIHRCTVCGHDIFDHNLCFHIPGERYKVERVDGGVEEVVCSMTIERVRFVDEEVSGES